MNRDFIVNTSSIDTFAKGLENEALKLEEILDYLIRMTNDMEEFFDTPTSHITKEALLEYLNKAKIPCNNLGELSRKVDLFNKNYKTLCHDTKVSVRGEEA